MTTDSIKTKPSLNLSALRKVFSLLAAWEKWLVAVLVAVTIIGIYWDWNIFYVRHTTEVPADGGQLVEGLVGQPHFINPILATTQTDETIVHAVFSGLYRYDNTGNLEPDLATALPEIGNDEKHYTVRLKPNLTWHDGKALTADDVLFTISKIQDENVQSPLRNLWLSTSVQKLDPLTVVFITKDVSGPFIQNLTVPLLPEHAWRNVTSDSYASSPLNLQPLGSGPFAIRQIEKNPDGSTKRMALASYAGHPLRSRLDGITLVFYANVDDMRQGYAAQEISSMGLATNDVASEPTGPNVHTFRVPLPQYQAIFLNTKSPGLSEPEVRKALALVVDSKALTDAAWGKRARAITAPPLGLVTTEPVLSSINSTEANILLDKAGWIKQANGIRSKGAATLSIKLLTSDTASFVVASQLLAQTWQSLGVAVQVQSVPTTSLISDYVRPRKYDALLFSQRTGVDPDPFAFWHSSQTKDPGLNVSNFSSSEVDSLITNARSSTNSVERREQYAKLASILNTSAPAIYINQSLYTYILNGDIQSSELNALVDPSWRLAEASRFYIRTTRTWK